MVAVILRCAMVLVVGGYLFEARKKAGEKDLEGTVMAVGSAIAYAIMLVAVSIQERIIL